MKFLNRIVPISWWLWALTVVAIIAAPVALAAPVAKASQGGVTITLFNDKCEIPAVSNLPMKATWTEGGKTYAGCWGGSEVGVVMAYFAEDRTVAAIPVQAFSRVSEI